MSKLVRNCKKSHQKLKQITQNKEIMLQQINNSYENLKKNREEWSEYQEELLLWESTLEDGL